MIIRLLVLLSAFVNLPVFAGPLGDEGSFGTGLLHPLFGIDHLLVALSVGMICAMSSKRFICLIPIGFLFFLALGGIAGVLHMAFPLVNLVVAGSVVAVGGLIALNKDFPVSFVMAFVGLLALFHGYEHGSQLADMQNMAAYGIGFIFGTVLLLLLGVLLGRAILHFDHQHRWLRYTGSAIAAFGSYLVVGVFV
ncbi:HupE/UreJ family protein [Shewanella sp. C32]|uniref:HupE/UreJ family protein n=1 Tax=Shewanella electrica TaxID=515560 RepID=A0ABT2FIL5_9GAMM|nr:HupE/UreJ family protein [Shewanella electrica]MCH1924265.1 HupE/UreJ family protein [Shewanella electrica]MCS4556168.1 HupE/UreJ family protein [Shewanella electrica]